jgi:hypothetical protein
MGTTFVTIDRDRDNKRGFWVRDGMLELWLRFLALHVEDPTEPGSAASEIRDQWLLASRGYFGGCVPHGLAEAFATSEGQAVVRKAVGSLLAALNEAPPHIDRDVLNLMGFSDGPFTRNVETRRLIEVGEAFLALLDGRITTGPCDTSFMPGCG